MAARMRSGDGTEVYQSSHRRPSDAAATRSSECSTRSGSRVTRSPVRVTGSRNGMSAGVQRAQRRLPRLAGESVEEDLAVEVVALVLQAAGHQAGALQPQRLAVDVEALGDAVHGTDRGCPDAGHRQAALVAVLDLLGPFDDDRIDH